MKIIRGMLCSLLIIATQWSHSEINLDEMEVEIKSLANKTTLSPPPSH